jgi:GT2 family glycosyltransferase
VRPSLGSARAERGGSVILSAANDPRPVRSVRVSVVVPSGNGRHLLPDCLDALRAQTYRDFEVVVVDNASTDGSPAMLRAHYPEVRLLELGFNGAFARAVNAGIRATDSEIVVLLNNDTAPEPAWLAELIGALDAAPDAGMAASKILLWDRRDTLHSAADFYGLDGVPGSRGVWTRDDGRFDRDRYVFGACGGAAAYRRSMLREVGLFDGRLVAYCEDVDLNLRAQAAGHRCVFAPRARVYHRLSATGGGPFASYYCGRNFITVLARDLPGPILRRHWPKVARAQLGFALQSARHAREPAARARLRGQLVGLLRLPLALAQRRRLQRRRQVPIEYLEALLARADRPAPASDEIPPLPGSRFDAGDPLVGRAEAG